jgi:hypothetical protein
MIGTRRAWRRALGVVVVGAAVVTLSGCAVIAVQIPTQLSPGTPARLGSSICASGSSGCTSNGNSMVPATVFPTATGQVLLGYRVPTATVAPASFNSQQGVMAFALNPSYASELQRLKPAPPGQKWVGYISNTQQYSNMAPIQADSLSAEFELVQAADGSPFAPPFKFAQVVGTRSVSIGFPPDRPVSCGPSLTSIFDEDPDPAFDSFEICVDSSEPANLDDNVSVATRDFGLLKPSATGTTRQGTLASLPFTLRYAGTAVVTANFALSASTTLPGAVAAPNPGSVLPETNSDTVVPVAIGVPSNAAPGTYDVTLTAKAVLGPTRVATGKLTVSAATGGGTTTSRKPRLTLILARGFSAALARTKGMTVLIGSTRAVRARVRLFQGRRKKAIISKLVRLRAPGPTKVKLKSARLRKGSFRIVVSGTGFTFRASGTLRK